MAPTKTKKDSSTAPQTAKKVKKASAKKSSMDQSVEEHPAESKIAEDFGTIQPYILNGIIAKSTFILDGWKLKQFNKQVCCYRTPPASQLPSPFADLDRDQDQKFSHITDTHVLGDVRLLFLHCREHADTLQTTMLSRHAPGARKAHSFNIRSLVIGPRAMGGNDENDNNHEVAVHSVSHATNLFKMAM